MTAEPNLTPTDNRKAFAAALTRHAANDKRIVAVCNDSVSSSGLLEFRDRFPDQLINVGIAEQNMVGVAAGLASSGYLPFVCAAGPFLSGRATEQIKADVAYSQFPVVLCAMSPGVSYGELGPTHHSIEDISWMRALPGLDIAVPTDAASTEQAVDLLVRDPRPTYMRVGRYKVPPVPDVSEEWQRGRGVRIGEGSRDVAFFTYGTATSRAIAAAELLEQSGITAAIVDVRYIAPLDTELILRTAQDCNSVVVAEEANVSGALGAAVAMLLAEHGIARPLKVVGPTQFAHTDSATGLLEGFGLSAEGLANAARTAVSSD